MAEFCKRCFIDTWRPNKYDSKHIVLTADNDFCESCGKIGPVVEYIDMDNYKKIENRDSLVLLIQSGKVRGCPECGVVYNDKDLESVVESFTCPYCHNHLKGLWMQEE